MSNELVLLALLAGTVVGAFTASRVGAAAWQGAVVVLAGNILSIAVLTFLKVDGAVWPIVISMLGSGIAGGVLKLKSNHIVTIYVLATIAQTIVAYFGVGRI